MCRRIDDGCTNPIGRSELMFRVSSPTSQPSLQPNVLHILRLPRLVVPCVRMYCNRGRHLDRGGQDGTGKLRGFSCNTRVLFLSVPSTKYSFLSPSRGIGCFSWSSCVPKAPQAGLDRRYIPREDRLPVVFRPITAQYQGLVFSSNESALTRGAIAAASGLAEMLQGGDRAAGNGNLGVSRTQLHPPDRRQNVWSESSREKPTK